MDASSPAADISVLHASNERTSGTSGSAILGGILRRTTASNSSRASDYFGVKSARSCGLYPSCLAKLCHCSRSSTGTCTNGTARLYASWRSALERSWSVRWSCASTISKRWRRGSFTVTADAIVAPPSPQALVFHVQRALRRRPSISSTRVPLSLPRVEITGRIRPHRRQSILHICTQAAIFPTGHSRDECCLYVTGQ